MSNLRHQTDNLSAAENAGLLDEVWESLEATRYRSRTRSAPSRITESRGVSRILSDVVPWEQVKPGPFQKP